MPAARTIRLVVFVLGLMAFGAGVGIYSANQYRPAPQPAVEGLLWPNPKQIREFVLIDQDGAPFDLARLRGKWSFVFFGYTHCPDVCPITLSVLGLVHGALAAEGPEGESVQTLFVTVDPKRDSPQRLADYVRYFDKDFIGLGGTQEQVSSLSSQLGVAYFHSPASADGNYLVDHSAAVFLI
ncbi:MAG: SCO family protein, partial [Gammaproteobacteria bacterium]